MAAGVRVAAAGLSFLNCRYRARLRERGIRVRALMDRRNTADCKTFVPVDASGVLEFRPWICDFVRKTLQLLGKSAASKEAAQLLRLVGAFERIGIGGETAASAPKRV